MGFLESFGTEFLILMLIALVISSIGFYKYVPCLSSSVALLLERCS